MGPPGKRRGGKKRKITKSTDSADRGGRLDEYEGWEGSMSWFNLLWGKLKQPQKGGWGSNSVSNANVKMNEGKHGSTIIKTCREKKNKREQEV